MKLDIANWVNRSKGVQMPK